MGSQTFCTAIKKDLFSEENVHRMGDNLHQLFIQKTIDTQNIKKNSNHKESKNQITQLKRRATYLKNKNKNKNLKTRNKSGEDIYLNVFSTLAV